MNGMRMAGDGAPGGFNDGHVPVPAAPIDDSLQVDYALQGPADLLVLAADATGVPLAAGQSATIELAVSTPLNDTGQRVWLTAQVPPGFEASLQPSDLDLLAGSPTASARLVLQALPNATAGNVTVLAASDLGFRATAVFSLALPPSEEAAATDRGAATTTTGPSAAAPAPGSAPTQASQEADHAHQEPSQDAPALSMVSVLGTLAAACAAAALRRR